MSFLPLSVAQIRFLSFLPSSFVLNPVLLWQLYSWGEPAWGTTSNYEIAKSIRTGSRLPQPKSTFTTTFSRSSVFISMIISLGTHRTLPFMFYLYPNSVQRPRVGGDDQVLELTSRDSAPVQGKIPIHTLRTSHLSSLCLHSFCFLSGLASSFG